MNKPYQTRNLPLQKGRFTIEDFSADANLIQVHYTTTAMRDNETMELCRSCFEQWLEDTGRLQWVSDTTGYNGDHYQQAGPLAIDDYWEYGEYETKTADLKAFVIAEVKAQDSLS